MKVILLKELKGRGGEGDVVDVAQGFAVNYLLPQGIALKATKGELKQLEQRRGNIAKRELARTTDADTIREALDGKTVSISVKVGEEGQLFGSVTPTMIAQAIVEQIGVNVDRKKIDLGRPIKVAGLHQVSVAIYREIKATINVKVIDEGGELEMLDEALNALHGKQNEAEAGGAEGAAAGAEGVGEQGAAAADGGAEASAEGAATEGAGADKGGEHPASAEGAAPAAPSAPAAPVA